MKRKSWKRWLIVIPVIIIGLIVMKIMIDKVAEYRQIPYIAFMSNHDRETCLFICKNGDIYASTSEEAFKMDDSELVERVRQDNYSDILEYVGKTKAKEVRKMYRLFSEVVLAEGYHVGYRSPNPTTPESGNYDDEKWYWYGFYFEGNGGVTGSTFYISDGERACSDKRAYEIVEWMYEVLKDYMKE